MAKDRLPPSTRASRELFKRVPFYAAPLRYTPDYRERDCRRTVAIHTLILFAGREILDADTKPFPRKVEWALMTHWLNFRFLIMKACEFKLNDHDLLKEVRGQRILDSILVYQGPPKPSDHKSFKGYWRLIPLDGGPEWPRFRQVACEHLEFAIEAKKRSHGFGKFVGTPTKPTRKIGITINETLQSAYQSRFSRGEPAHGNPVSLPLAGGGEVSESATSTGGNP